MARPKAGDIVAVEWIDAWCDEQETREHDWKDSCVVTTYGVLRRNGDVVTVVSEPFKDGVGRSTTHIPRPLVRRVRRLEEA